MDKSFAILGLGKFGSSVAAELTEAGADVLAVDIDKERVHALADTVTCAISIDICDHEAVESLGLSNMDAVIIAITQNLDVSIIATIYAKEAGVPFVIAKAKDELHKKILLKVGADEVIIPERDAGIRTARHLASGNILNFIELSDSIKMIEIDIRKEWVGHTLRELNLRQQEGINVVALRKNGELDVNPSPDKELTPNVSMLIILNKKNLKKIM